MNSHSLKGGFKKMDIDRMPLNEIWQEIDRKANEQPTLLKDMNATYSFTITGNDEGTYGLTFSDGIATVIDGGINDADCSLTMSVDNFRKLLQGNLNSATAYMTGRLKVKGNIGLALKLENLLKKYSL